MKPEVLISIPLYDARITYHREERHTDIEVALRKLKAVIVDIGRDGQATVTRGMRKGKFPILGFANESGRLLEVIPRYELDDGQVLSEEEGKKSRIFWIPAERTEITACDPTEDVRGRTVRKAVFQIIAVESPDTDFSITLSVTPPQPLVN